MLFACCIPTSNPPCLPQLKVIGGNLNTAGSALAFLTDGNDGGGAPFFPPSPMLSLRPTALPERGFTRGKMSRTNFDWRRAARNHERGTNSVEQAKLSKQ